jgi:hypothetical protein
MEDKEIRFEFHVNLKKVRFKESPEIVSESRKCNLLNSLLMAYQIQEYIDGKRVKSLKDFCKWIPVSHSRICQLLKLLLLAPDIQEDIILKDNDKIASLTERTIRRIPMQIDWDKQREMWQKCLKP